MLKPSVILANKIVNVFGFKNMDDRSSIVIPENALKKIQNDFLLLYDELSPLVRSSLATKIAEKTCYQNYKNILCDTLNQYGYNLVSKCDARKRTVSIEKRDSHILIHREMEFIIF